MTISIRPTVESLFSPAFFMAAVALNCLPLGIYFIRVTYPATVLAQTFGYRQPLFDCMCLFECFMPEILFVLAVVLDRIGSTFVNLRGLIAGHMVCFWCLTFFATTFPSCADACLRDRFTSNRWKDSLSVNCSEEVRLYMISDLLARYQLEGKTRQEIHALLGVPPSDGNSSCSRDEYLYFLGYSRLPAPDLQHLRLVFRKDVVTGVDWLHHM
ncbi:MAG: hypothetical protein JST01_09690 [Cyanobacteria bacterium SZAS TMP-1]|nr:hypothetical protein [Cyanobacteria bacterium SZAS TMP-1]